MPARVTDADYRVLAEFRYQIRRFLGSGEQAARAAGLEPRQHQLLLALKGLPEGIPPTIGALADRLQVEHHSAVEMVDRLEDRGLVERSRDGSDRRRVLVAITSSGDRLLRALGAAHRVELRDTMPALMAALSAVPGSRPRRLARATAHERGMPVRRRHR